MAVIRGWYLQLRQNVRGGIAVPAAAIVSGVLPIRQVSANAPLAGQVASIKRRLGGLFYQTTSQSIPKEVVFYRTVIRILHVPREIGTKRQILPDQERLSQTQVPIQPGSRQVHLGRATWSPLPQIEGKEALSPWTAVL